MFEPLATLIRLHREARGLTIDELSALTGISPVRLMQLEEGDDDISLDLLVKITDALGIRELRIGGLDADETVREVGVIEAGAQAIDTATRIVKGVSQWGGFDRVKGPIEDYLASILNSHRR